MASIARVTLINSLIAASDLSKKKAAFTGAASICLD
jgi:hypothetical protein